MKIGNICISYPGVTSNVYIDCMHDSVVYNIKNYMFFGYPDGHNSFYDMMLKADHIISAIKSIEYENW